MNLIRIFFITVLLPFSPHVSADQQADEYLSISGVIDDDLYLAGGQIDLYATVDGDAIVAGGQLNLEGDVKADLVAAGGDIEVRGVIADDVRLAGGNVRVQAEIGDDLVAAGGRIRVGPKSVVAGKAWLNAGEVFFDGKVADMLRVNGGSVVIAGTVKGNAEIWAERIEISDTAVIAGKLEYRSPHPAKIADGARIDGEIIHTPVDLPVASVVAGVLFAGLVYLLALIVTAVALYLVFPGVAAGCSNSIRNQPWMSLGLGLAVVAGGPVVIILLLSTGVGFILALLLLAAYLVVLLSGYIAGAYFVSETGLRLLHKSKDDETSSVRVGHAIALALTIVALAIVNIIPFVGGLINWLTLLAGVGALKWQIAVTYMNKD